MRMTDLRAAREAAFWRHWRNLQDDPRRELPALLDDLERLDAQHAPEPVTVKRAGDVPSDDELAAYLVHHPEVLDEWVRRQETPPVPVAQPVPAKSPSAARKPPTRRRAGARS